MKIHASFERSLIQLYAVSGALILLLLGLLMHSYQWSFIPSLTLLMLVVSVGTVWAYHHFQRIINPLFRLTLLIESMKQEDYNVRVSSHFQSGILHKVFAEFNQLMGHLQKRNDRYNQQMFLLYQLIEQLETPIAVFDRRHRLSHANRAFSDVIGQPWASVQGHEHHTLGLTVTPNNDWAFQKGDRHENWELRHSSFEEERDTHHFVMLINITESVRQTQQDAWQQIIRVMSHEIKNSMTPIGSLSQSILSAAESGDETLSPLAQRALNTIHQRSRSLVEFVRHYGQLGQPLNLQRTTIAADDFLNAVVALFPQQHITLNTLPGAFTFDKVLMEQVMINMIKNAIEASESHEPIHITAKKTRNDWQIHIEDNGHGILNPDNLFVPLYTTKKEGQGIGLVFSRRIVEQHGGRLSLSNRRDGEGAVAVIRLPQVAEG